MQTLVNESGYQLKADKDGTTFEVEVSPYGDSGKTYNGIAEFVQHWILQLEHFRPQHLKNPAHLAWIDRDNPPANPPGIEVIVSADDEDPGEGLH
jgi:hypothetical protein